MGTAGGWGIAGTTGGGGKGEVVLTGTGEGLIPG